MDMPVTLDLVQCEDESIFREVFNFFHWVDKTFSTFKKDSEISRYNRREITIRDLSLPMKNIFNLSDKTRRETAGYFNVEKDGKIDPSGIVKGWAILEASKIIKKKGVKNFYVDAGGDIQAEGVNENGLPWKIGIRNPFNRHENVKILKISGGAVATSGTYIRGQHIYDPFAPDKKITDIVSLTVVGKNILDADRFATAAFAMGKKGIGFIETTGFLEGYMIDNKGVATYTSGFNNFMA